MKLLKILGQCYQSKASLWVDYIGLMRTILGLGDCCSVLMDAVSELYPAYEDVTNVKRPCGLTLRARSQLMKATLGSKEDKASLWVHFQVCSCLMKSHFKLF